MVTLQKRPQDISAVVTDAVEASRPFINGRNHTLHISLAAGKLTVNADRARLCQVLVNVLNNAAKYTDPGGTISLQVARDGAQLSISVRDTGMGLPEELLPQIFDMFTQAERTIDRSQGGLGIGLTVARSIIALHDGSIEVHSDGLGKGSEFVIHLPLLQDLPQTDEKTPVPGVIKGAGRRVLIVDDNVDAADGMAMLLEFAGQRVRTAYDGHEAIRAAEEFRPELILLDLGLPGMDGYEVARHLRANIRDGHDPVIAALTGYGDADDRLLFLLGGHAGLRISEMLALEWRHIHWDQAELLVVAGKGNNGNDGRDAAVRLRRRGVRVCVVDAADAPAPDTVQDVIAADAGEIDESGQETMRGGFYRSAHGRGGGDTLRPRSVVSPGERHGDSFAFSRMWPGS